MRGSAADEELSTFVSNFQWPIASIQDVSLRLAMIGEARAWVGSSKSLALTALGYKFPAHFQSKDFLQQQLRTGHVASFLLGFGSS